MGHAFINANVHTMTSPRARASAFVVDGDAIVLVGSDDEARELAQASGWPATDLKGRVVLPGFVDAHTHFLHVGVKHTRPDLRGCKTRTQALETLGAWLDANPGDYGVIAEGWDEGEWQGAADAADRRAIIQEDLDALCPNRPLVARRICGHIAVANSLALPPIWDHWPNPKLVNQETGVLLEQPSLYLNEVMPAPPEVLDEALVHATRTAHQLGITALGDYEQAPLREALLRAARHDRLRVRVACSIYTQQLASALGDGFRTGRRAPGPDVDGQPSKSPWLQDAGLKVFHDGSLGGHSAYLREPYLDKDTRGLANWTDEEAQDWYRTAHEAGVQIHAHVIGDAAVDQGLDAFAALQGDDAPVAHGATGDADPRVTAASAAAEVHGDTSEPGERGASPIAGKTCDGVSLRHRFEHYEIVHDDQIARTAALGIVASSQPNFVGEWSAKGGMYEERLGERFRVNNRFQQFKKAGLRLAFGSDGMPLGPLYGLHCAIHHPVAEERLSPEEAVWHYTHEAAWSLHMDHVGSLEAGKKADFLILAQTKLDDQPKQWWIQQVWAGGNLQCENEGPLPRED